MTVVACQCSLCLSLLLNETPYIQRRGRVHSVIHYSLSSVFCVWTMVYSELNVTVITLQGVVQEARWSEQCSALKFDLLPLSLNASNHLALMLTHWPSFLIQGEVAVCHKRFELLLFSLFTWNHFVWDTLLGAITSDSSPPRVMAVYKPLHHVNVAIKGDH